MTPYSYGDANTDAQAVTRKLRGHWHGSYGIAFCPAHANTRTPALSLAEGDDGRLLVHCFAGCTFQAVMDALRGLGLAEGDSTYPRPDPAQHAQRRAQEKAQAERRARQAARLWAESLPIAGTAAERYLRNARGITCFLPGSLRFHGDCWHASGRRFPAMLGLVEGGDAPAVHRTYLRADGSGKAEVDPPKTMLGNTQGGAVRLSGKPGPLVVAEGLETALLTLPLKNVSQG